MKKYSYFLTFIAIAIISCNPSSQKNELPKTETFTSKEIGWTIEIPRGFQSLSGDKVKAHEQKVKETIENTSGTVLDLTGVVRLFDVQKNRFNTIQATIQPYDLKRDGDYDKSRRLFRSAVYDAYTAKSIKIDTATAQTNYAGKLFQTFVVKFYGPNGDIILHQVMMNQLIKEYDFGITINYNNPEDGKLIFDAIANSKFSN